jgi:myo-inositol-1(or 4)-monophosphatase
MGSDITEMNYIDLNKFALNIIEKMNYVSDYLVRQFSSIQHNSLELADDVETEADNFVASYLADFIHSRYPDINIDTEEDISKLDVASEYTVVIDSIDGSKHFLAGIPFFGTNISLKHNQTTLFSACAIPLSPAPHSPPRSRACSPRS